MADLMSNAASWLAGVQKAQLSETVTLKRGASSTTGVAATIGRSDFAQEFDDGHIEESREVDFLIDRTDYAFDGTVSEPQSGDLIERTIGGNVETYTALSPGGAPPWRWADPYHNRIRVHTKRTAVA